MSLKELEEIQEHLKDLIEEHDDDRAYWRMMAMIYKDEINKAQKGIRRLLKSRDSWKLRAQVAEALVEDPVPIEVERGHFPTKEDIAESQEAFDEYAGQAVS